MFESPVLQKLFAEKTQDMHARFLTGRFGEVPHDVMSRIRRIRKEERLNELVDFAAVCPSIEAFRKRLES